MTRWAVSTRSSKYDHPTPEKIEQFWIVSPVSLSIGPAFIAEFPFTPEGQQQADTVAQYLNSEYIAGMKEAQRAARHALGLLAPVEDEGEDP